MSLVVLRLLCYVPEPGCLRLDAWGWIPEAVLLGVDGRAQDIILTLPW
jgi:hypothetical protein